MAEEVGSFWKLLVLPAIFMDLHSSPVDIHSYAVHSSPLWWQTMYHCVHMHQCINKIQQLPLAFHQIALSDSEMVANIGLPPNHPFDFRIFSDLPWNQHFFNHPAVWNWPSEAPSTEKLIFQNGAFSIPHPEKGGKLPRIAWWDFLMGKWWLTNGIQWKPMETNGIWDDRVDRCQLSRNERHCDAFFELQLFSEFQIS